MFACWVSYLRNDRTLAWIPSFRPYIHIEDWWRHNQAVAVVIFIAAIVVPVLMASFSSPTVNQGITRGLLHASLPTAGVGREL